MKTPATLAAMCIASTVFAHAGLRLFASDWDTNSVYEFDATSGALIRVLIPPRADNAIAMTGMAIGSDGALYLTDFNTDAIRRYNVNTGALLGTFVQASEGGLDDCTGLTFGPDGHLYATNGYSGGVLKFNGFTGEFMGTFISPTVSRASQFMLFDEGNVYITDQLANSVKKFDATTGALLVDFACCAPRGCGVTLTPWGELLVASWENRSIERFDKRTGTHLGTLVSGVYCNGIAMGPDGYLYAGEAQRHRIERYDARTGEFKLALGEGSLLDPWQLVFAPPACAADLNVDGVADFFDYIDFTVAFCANSETADFNLDGAVDFFDYLDFVSAFAQGC